MDWPSLSVEVRASHLARLSQEARNAAPVYAHLARTLARQPDLLHESVVPPAAWMGGTTLCAATQSVLAAYGRIYPSQVAATLADGRASELLGGFREAVRVAALRPVQVLDPWFVDLAPRAWARLVAPDARFDVIDVGCGAGLGLIGEPPRGREVVSRVGVDRHIPDTDAESVRWLQSCLPVDHVERRRALSAGLAAVHRAEGLVLVEADAQVALEPILAGRRSGHVVIQANGLLHGLGPSGQAWFSDLIGSWALECARASVLLVDPDAGAVCRVLRSWGLHLPRQEVEAIEVSRRLVAAVSWRGSVPELVAWGTEGRGRPDYRELDLPARPRGRRGPVAGGAAATRIASRPRAAGGRR